MKSVVAVLSLMSALVAIPAAQKGAAVLAPPLPALPLPASGGPAEEAASPGAPAEPEVPAPPPLEGYYSGEPAPPPAGLDRSMPPHPRGPLFSRYVEDADPCPPPTDREVQGEWRNRAGSVARIYIQGSRAEESEAYRGELARLPLGQRWDWYRDRIQELGFTFRDAAWSAMDHPRFGLEKNRLYFRLEIECDSGGKVSALRLDPHF